MLFVQWKSGTIVGKVHLASNHLKTLCGRRIPEQANAVPKSPRDKTKICKRCRDVEEVV
jgi:hypothetical protein